MSLFMLIHVVSGTAAVIAGAVALIAKKGQSLHRKAGFVFFVSMLCSTSVGAAIAIVTPGQLIAFFGGVLAFYLVLTSWIAVQPVSSALKIIEGLASVLILVVGVGLLVMGINAINDPSGGFLGYTPVAYFFLATISLLGAGLDLVVFCLKGVSGKYRIARHLWRMCFAYFIAAGSLFTGPGAKAFPEFIRESGILSAPEPIILLVMLFWWAKTLWFGKAKTQYAP